MQPLDPEAETLAHLRDSPSAYTHSTSFPRRREPASPARERAKSCLDPRLRGDDEARGPIWKNGAFRFDVWVCVADGEELPDAPVILSRKRWIAEREQLGDRNAALGLQLEPGEAIDDIAADLSRFALVALSFPKFSDGRAFSTARLLREKYGFTGELRAVGNVLSDQIPLMRRVGFDAFEVTHAPTRGALADGRIREVALHYQPTAPSEPLAGTRPWLRRGGG